MNMITLGAVLLLVGGLVHTIPPLNAGVTAMTGGTPIIQIAVGACSIVIGLIMLVKKTALS